MEKRLHVPRNAVLVAVLFLATSCASVEFKRETQTSGTFESTGVALTFLSWDLPKGALDIARENASDSGFTHLQIDSVRVYPYLGPLDWILDIFMVRHAKITGTWGFPGQEPTASDASQ